MKDTWALVLAAGEGNRLSSLTTTASGVAIPKQFCSLRGGNSLLEETLRRAATVAPLAGILTVVAEQHRQWWRMSLRALPAGNLIVQPENKGTGIGVLLPLLHLAQRDPEATVLVLPSDHFVQQKAVLIGAMWQAARLAMVNRRHIYLLGLEPDSIDPELGYILPRNGDAAAYGTPVRLFVEKPPVELAHGLLEAGALSNTFILAASAAALIGLYAARYPTVLEQMRSAAARNAAHPRDPRAARDLYPQLPQLDFSRDLLQGQESLLRVLRVPACGWSDLGTPQRVAEALSHVDPNPWPDLTTTAYLSLAAQRVAQSHPS